MDVLILLFLSILPVILVGWYIYHRDREKEPIKLLAKVFFKGTLAVIATVIISLIIDKFFPYLGSSSPDDLVQTFFYAFIGIAIVEEFTKWFAVYKTTYNNPNFDETYDIIVYGAFSALGFACLENIMAVFTMGGIKTALMRAFTSIPGHTSYGIISGYFLGKAKIASLNNRKDLERKNMILSIIVPTLAHGFYDFCILAQNPFLVLVDLIYIIILYIYIFIRIKKMSAGSRLLSPNNVAQTQNSNQVAVNNGINQNSNVMYQNNDIANQSNGFAGQNNIPNQSSQSFSQNQNLTVGNIQNNFCSNCGQAVSGNFCTNCGNKVN